MTLTLVGLSHQSTPVAVRERAFVSLAQAGELAASLAEDGEAVCLSTCNRTELYLGAEDAAAAESTGVATLADLAGLDRASVLPGLYRLYDEAAALHLFRVAAGLDSLVPGEAEILGQVREAFEDGAVRTVFHRLLKGCAMGCLPIELFCHLPGHEGVAFCDHDARRGSPPHRQLAPRHLNRVVDNARSVGAACLPRPSPVSLMRAPTGRKKGRR